MNVLICIFLCVSTVPVLVLQASVGQFGLSFIFVFFPPGCPAAANVTGRIRERSFFVNLNISAGATDTRDPIKSRIGTLVPTSRAVFRPPTRASLSSFRLSHVLCLGLFMATVSREMPNGQSRRNEDGEGGASQRADSGNAANVHQNGSSQRSRRWSQTGGGLLSCNHPF